MDITNLDRLKLDHHTSRPGPLVCWLWSGPKRIRLRHGQYSVLTLHWVLANEDLPANWVVWRKCQSPNCVNPLHLDAGPSYPNLGTYRKKTKQIQPDAESQDKLPPTPGRKVPPAFKSKTKRTT